ncbi:hypothetical protein GF339_10825 [candidate division KSB3 bacterium]|uniref:HTH tetR-type domain-containing protein n=1 Tax=candidate division KSB3 bacterium TaxID=2044937 RepID=A0A9D5JVV3_9BACT|nr:hypothetical protein [candidate division KSB3 bacterium]MBD3325069.1 hypothetical protein [candidate division KSB3 bacterium]
MAQKEEISLRERKYAQTKIALAQALRERLRHKRLREISVKEVCETIPVSEVTFYNYFPKKTDVLAYTLKLWYLEAGWHLKQWEASKRNIEIVEAFFEFTARSIEEYPQAMNETLVFFLQQRSDLYFTEISLAEKLLAYPDLEGIEQITVPQNSQEEKILKPYVINAIEAGELPEDADPEMVLNMLESILFGAVMVLHESDPAKIRPFYRTMLGMLWAGLKAEVREPRVS